MAEQSNTFKRLFPWGLLITGLLIAGCVFSHDPTALQPHHAFPPAPTPSNLFGAPGNWLAAQLFLALGSAVYVLPAGWFVLAVYLLKEERAETWSWRLVGWALVIPCLALLADRVAGDVSYPAAGGTVGAWLGLWLYESFGVMGSVLIAGTLLGVGLMLSMDFILMALWQKGKQTVRFLFGLFMLVIPGGKREKTAKRSRPSRKPIPITPVEERSDEYEDPIGQDLEDEMDDDPSSNDDDLDLVPIHRPAAVDHLEAEDDYELPSLNLLDEAQPFPYEEHDQHLRERAALLEKTLKDFDLNVRVVGINTGPVITQYELALETGLRLNKVTRLAEDIALNLKVASVRMVAPIPGKNTVGVEVPNEYRALVCLKEVILTAGKQTAKMKIPLFLGKDSEGRSLIYDLAEMPHLLIAGRTGTGKSVSLNSIILSMLMTRRPDEVKMLMIDPKRAELSEYGQLPHLMHPVVTDMKKAEAILSWAIDEMERRYDILSQARVRSIAAFNKLKPEEKERRLASFVEEGEEIPENIPSIVIIVDEMADLMMTMKREVEGHIIRLAQKSRAAGIHLVVATQKPTVDVITGLIKSNLPARICFQVSSRSDSRVVLDEMGAEKLLGKGDMLFLQPGTSLIVRAQGTYAGDDEITRVVEALECEPEFSEELLQLGNPVAEGVGNLHERLRSRDEVYEQAIEIVVREGRGSVSLLQRALGIGYGRAARIIDFMAEDGLVGAYRGSSAREVLVSLEEWEEMKNVGEMTQQVG